MFYSANPCRDYEAHTAWCERQEAIAQAASDEEFVRVQPILSKASNWREKAKSSLKTRTGQEWTLLELLQDGMEHEPLIDRLFSELLASDAAKELRTELAARWSEKIHQVRGKPRGSARG